MTDKELFAAAYKASGFSKRELGKRAKVSYQSVFDWRNKSADGSGLSEKARGKLQQIVDEAKAGQIAA